LNAPLPAPDDYKWELYHLTEDYTQANDLAAKMPGKLMELQKVFQEEAKKYNVYPLNNDTFARALAPRPSATAGQTVFTYSVTAWHSNHSPNILASRSRPPRSRTWGGGDG
jgi:arylsulfatase